MPRNHLTVRSPAVDPPSDADAGPTLADVLRYVDDCHHRLLGAMGTTVLAAYDAGRALNAHRNATPHGDWENSVRKILREEGLAVTLRTCQRYMKVARNLAELLKAEWGDDAAIDDKATRASLLKFLRQHGLLSINKVLALGKNDADKPNDASTSRARDGEGARPSSGDDCFITPPAIDAAVAEFFERIDLDSRDPAAARSPLSTERSLAPADDGSGAPPPLIGNAFVHPPLDCILPFVERTIAAVAGGEAANAIILAPAVTDAVYAGPLQPYVRGFLRERPLFATRNGERVVPATPYMLVFVTQSPELTLEFAESFGHLCDIYYPHIF